MGSYDTYGSIIRSLIDASSGGSSTIGSLTGRYDDSLRPDGTRKGSGWLGPLEMTDGSGRVMTEYSVGVRVGGREMDIPTLVPTLSREEVNYLRAGGKPTRAIVEKARAHAEEQIRAGRSPFK